MKNESKERTKPAAAAIDWKKYTGSEQSWTNDLINLEPLLTEWKRQADEASERLSTRQVISHRDMDCKNVLWDRRHRPFIIDWEAAGYTNPPQEPGTKEVIRTMKALMYYDKRIPELKYILTKYAGS